MSAEYATSSREWSQWVMICHATWTTCHLLSDEAASLAYRRALRRVPYGPLCLAVELLTVRCDRFPAISEFAAAISEIRQDLRRTEDAERVDALARAALPVPREESYTVADFDAGHDAVAAARKAELQAFGRRHGMGAEWLAAAFADAERLGPAAQAMRAALAAGQPPSAARAAAAAVGRHDRQRGCDHV